MTTRGSLWRRASTASGLLFQGARSSGFAGLFGDLRDVAAKCVGSVVRRFGWAFADQLVSSGTNFLLGVLVARTVGIRDLGAFSVAYATFTFSLGGVRTVVSELLVIRHSALSAHEWRDGVSARPEPRCWPGSSSGPVVSLRPPDSPGPYLSVLTIVGVSLPLLLVQDVSRFALLARQRGAPRC